MRSGSWRWVCSIAVIVAFIAPPAPGQTAGESGRVTSTLTVHGNVSNPLSLTVADLRKFPVHRVDDARIVRTDGGSVESVHHLAGCLLRDVLDAARLSERGRFDLRRTIIVATANDGYKAVFSWNELFNTAVGDGVLVVYERDGSPLGDDEGRIALVSLKDTRPGPRHVKWLASIESVRVSD